MTFQKFLGKKGIFAICTGGYLLYLFFGWVTGMGTPFPFSGIIYIIVLVWIIVIINFLIRYGLKSRKKIKQ